MHVLHFAKGIFLLRKTTPKKEKTPGRATFLAPKLEGNLVFFKNCTSIREGKAENNHITILASDRCVVVYNSNIVVTDATTATKFG